MTFRPRIVLFLAVLLLVPASLALASGLPAASPAPLVAAAPSQPLVAAFSTAAQVCPHADLPVLRLTTAQPLADDICGACSDASCLGEPIGFACMPGFRCIVGPSCVSTERTCGCKIIG